MGKVFLLAVAVAIGYSIGFRDARQYPDHALTRAVKLVRETFGAESRNDVDAIMTRIEGKN